MAQIRTLKNNSNEAIYPQTLTSAVFNSSNVSLENLLALKANQSTTYTKKEVDDMLAAVSTLDIRVVTSLPLTEISTTTIYLLKVEGDINNNYEEYLYVNGVWELIGSTQVDLSNYYTKTETGEQFAKLNLYSDTTINIGRKSNTNIGQYSTAEGYNTTASGDYSHVEGATAIASGVASHAEGNSTTANGENQHVQGKYNIEDTTSAHIVGNGSNNSNRSNAHTLDWSGNAWYQGSIKCGGTGYNDAPNTVITSGSVIKIWTGTQAEYDALVTKEATTLYMITG